MLKGHIEKIASELNIKQWQVESVTGMLEEGATVPFIARYRKEATGSLDEVSISSVRERMRQMADLDKRRDAILRYLEEQGKLTEELSKQISAADTLTILEDIYLPFRPKRRTKATIAKEKGLEPLAQALFDQDDIIPEKKAIDFVNSEKGVDCIDDALAGARDIIAEWINEDQSARHLMRKLFIEKGSFIASVVSGKEEEGAKYRDYFDWHQNVTKAPSHRVLAVRRGEKEGYLNLRVLPPEEDALNLLKSLFVKSELPASQQVGMAVCDSYKRLLCHSMETELRVETKKRAENEAIKVFADNLRQVLLIPPLGQKSVMAIDPGFRTGCKVVCLDPQGKLVYADNIYPHVSEQKRTESRNKIIDMCSRFKIEAIAIGNGTAGRETESFVRALPLSREIEIVMVNESGASIYSASDIAREEFPHEDITIRGAVSIGRRLMDPLAELVKIDPKSIGIGQYQHDVDQKALKSILDDVVISCVNAVGVEVNTASKQLLSYVSGLGPQLAGNIVAYRDEHGPFVSRESLMQVPRLGVKAFEQAAGFLRIRGADNPLDDSAVHPESYNIVESMAEDLGCSVFDLIRDGELRKKINKKAYVTDAVGIPTLDDIIKELAKPGRDPRAEFEVFAFAEGVEKIDDLKAGMELPGVVTNITGFGVFVDIGVHRDGLIHVSQLADHFVKDPKDVAKVNDKVMVTVLGTDLERKRISLSMRDKPHNGTNQSFGSEKTPGKYFHKPTPKDVSNSFKNPFAEALNGK